MPPPVAALYSLAAGLVLWAFGYYAQRQGWIFNRRTEDNKLLADRLKTVEAENLQLLALVQELRTQIIQLLMERIGAQEVNPELHRVLTATAEDVRRIRESGGDSGGDPAGRKKEIT